MTFLFDIGNVLLKLHFERFHQVVFGLPTPLPPEPHIPKILDNINAPYETGELSCDDFVTRSLAAIPQKLTSPEFIAAWNDIFSLNAPMWDVVRHLKENGHRLILFSNTNTLHARAFLAQHSEFSLFDHHHFSQDVGANKPHDAFYQKALDQYHLVPAETFYLDDLPANIATGKRFGFQSWQYNLNDHPACLDWLSKIPSAGPLPPS